MAIKSGQHKTVSKEHGSTKGAHGSFHKGGAMKKSGHHGLIGDGGKGKGRFMVSTSNVGKLGHKGA